VSKLANNFPGKSGMTLPKI